MKFCKFGFKCCLSTSEFGKFKCRYCIYAMQIQRDYRSIVVTSYGSRRNNVGIVVRVIFPMCVKNIIFKYCDQHKVGKNS